MSDELGSKMKVKLVTGKYKKFYKFMLNWLNIKEVIVSKRELMNHPQKEICKWLRHVEKLRLEDGCEKDFIE